MTIYIITQEEQNKTNLALSDALNVEYVVTNFDDIMIDSYQKIWNLKGLQMVRRIERIFEQQQERSFLLLRPYNFSRKLA